MKRFLNALHFLFFTYPVGLLLGIIVGYLRWRGFIRLVHPERFPRWQRGVIIAANHPSLLEPILLPGLFLWQLLFHPFLFSPWSTPDLANYRSWLWWWIRPRAVFIPRGRPKAAVQALRRLRCILRKGGIVLLFPEGGRTSSVRRGEVKLCSTGGKSLRPLNPGLAYLAQKTQALVVSLWIEGTDRVMPNSPDRTKLYHRFPKFRGNRVTIRVGSGMRFSRHDHKTAITQTVQDELLQLADEDDSAGAGRSAPWAPPRSAGIPPL